MAAQIRSSYDLEAKTQQNLSFQIWIEPKLGPFQTVKYITLLNEIEFIVGLIQQRYREEASLMGREMF